MSLLLLLRHGWLGREVLREELKRSSLCGNRCFFAFESFLERIGFVGELQGRRDISVEGAHCVVPNGVLGDDIHGGVDDVRGSGIAVVEDILC